HGCGGGSYSKVHVIRAKSSRRNCRKANVTCQEVYHDLLSVTSSPFSYIAHSALRHSLRFARLGPSLGPNQAEGFRRWHRTPSVGHLYWQQLFLLQQRHERPCSAAARGC